MRLRLFLCALLLALPWTAHRGSRRADATLPKPAAFGVAAHNDVNIEWWYVNAHVTTDKGRHLALIGSFFRFGTGVNPLDGSPMPRAHYLIYAVTDLDKKTQRPYSLADAGMIALLKQFGPLLAAQNPRDKGVRAFLAGLDQGKLPAAASEDRRAGVRRQRPVPPRLREGKHAGGDERDQHGLRPEPERGRAGQDSPDAGLAEARRWRSAARARRA